MTARPIKFTEIEAAVTEWVMTAAGLDDQHVWWSHLYGRRNTDSPYIVLGWPTIRRYGKDWARFDNTTDPSNPVMVIEGPRTLNLYIQCYGDQQSGDEAAKSILETVCARVNLPSQQKKFRAAHIGIGVISDITSPFGSESFEPRSYCNIEVNCGATLREPISTIERVEVSINEGPILRVPPFIEGETDETTADAGVTGTGSVT